MWSKAVRLSGVCMSLSTEFCIGIAEAGRKDDNGKRLYSYSISSVRGGGEATTDENSDVVAVTIYGYRGCSRCRTTNLQEQWIEGRGRSGF
ncbi:hypothetical protein ACI65C_007634, partial [Semiaphis heraclei]